MLRCFFVAFGQSGADEMEEEKWEEQQVNTKEVWITDSPVYSIKQLHFSQVDAYFLYIFFCCFVAGICQYYY